MSNGALHSHTALSGPVSGSALGQGQLAAEGKLPFSVAVPSQSPEPKEAAAFCQTLQERKEEGPVQSQGNELIDELGAQLKQFENIYRGLAVNEAKPALRHFQQIVEQTDKRYDAARLNALKEVERAQIILIQASTQKRNLRNSIESYLADLGTAGGEQPIGDEAEALKIEAVIEAIYKLLNGRDTHQTHEKLQDFLAVHPNLAISLEQHHKQDKLEKRILERLSEIENHTLALKQLRISARLMIARSYEKLSYFVQAYNLKKEACSLTGNLMADSTSRAKAAVIDRDANFCAMYQALLAFKEIHGHCDVPRRYKQDPKLAIWTANLRSRRKKGLLPDSRVQALDQVGFHWQSSRSNWASHLEELEKFIKQHGHSFVPMYYPENPELATWVRNLRKDCRRKAVSQSRIDQLTKLGFDFQVLDRKWYERLEELRSFRFRFGHCRVPHRWKENPTLARWVCHQRQAWRLNQLSLSRLALLEAAGFEWAPAKGRPRKGGGKAKTYSATLNKGGAHMTFYATNQGEASTDIPIQAAEAYTAALAGERLPSGAQAASQAAVEYRIGQEANPWKTT